MLSRRKVIRQMLVTSAGIMLIPSCMEDRTKSSFLLKNFNITAEQENMLAELAESIIPKTSSPGAKDVYAHQFALKMVDDCATKDEQQAFTKGMKAFENYSEKKNGKSFLKASAQERSKVLEELEKSKDDNADEVSFYRMMKSLTVRAYTSSQYYLTQVQGYNIIPGPYKGSVPVKPTA